MEPVKLTLLTPTQPPPPTKPTYFVDASILKKASCLREVIWTIRDGIQAGPNWSQNYKAGYGSAFHRGIEYYYSLKPEARLGEMPRICEKASEYYSKYTPYIPQTPREFRTTEHLISTLQAYYELYGIHDALTPVITGKETGLLETKFYHPYYQSVDLVLVGTIDMIAEYYGELVIVDHKTTSAFQGAKEYFRSYGRNIQTQFYVWMFEKLSGKKLPVVINGIFLKKETKEAKKEGRFDGVSFDRERFEYTVEQQEEFEGWLLEQLEEIRLTIEAGFNPDGNFAACHQQYSLCKYFGICSLPPKEQPAAIAACGRDVYNPLTFSET